MSFGRLAVLAVGLSMDAFAVSVCKGFASGHSSRKGSLLCGVWFGGFQMLMPLIGFFMGTLFVDAIQAIDHWIAFGLLSVIGINMIREAFEEDADTSDADYSARSMFVVAVATSIDALAVGISLAMTGNVSIWTAVALIGTVTFVFSACGVSLGSIFGSRLGNKAEIVGGALLLLLGLSILLEHLEIFS